MGEDDGFNGLRQAWTSLNWEYHNWLFKLNEAKRQMELFKEGRDAVHKVLADALTKRIEMRQPPPTSVDDL